jgi:N-carbamoylputrescine amidase
VSGCYVLSSNFSYPLAEGFTFEGLSAASDPDGTILAVCDATNPFMTVDIDVAAAEAAKRTYPRYILSAARDD